IVSCTIAGGVGLRPARAPSRGGSDSMKPNRVLVSSIALALVVATACTSSTMIQTNVPASVYLDGEYVGTTPYTMTDTKIVGSTTTLRLEAPGYEPLTA